MSAILQKDSFTTDNKVQLLGLILSYTKYVSDYCNNNGLPDYVKKFGSLGFGLQNISELSIDEVEEYIEAFSNHLALDYQLGSDSSLPEFMFFDEFSSIYSPSSAYLSEDSLHTIIAEQSFFNSIRGIQKSESKNNTLDGDNPSVFVFVKYDHRENLFTYHGEVDASNPEVIHGIDGVNTIFDIEEREETAFIIKDGFHGLSEMRTGNYNEFVASHVLSELKQTVFNEDSPLYPYFLMIGVGEDSFSKYECTKKMCAEFLSPTSSTISALKLVELDTDAIVPFLSEHYKDIRLFCDAKDESILYTFEGDDVLHRYIKPIFADNPMDFANLVEMSPLEAIPESRCYEFIDDDADIRMNLAPKKEPSVKMASKDSKNKDALHPTLVM